MLLALLIGTTVAGFLFMKLKKANEENLNYKKSLTQVYALTKDVNSGDVLTADMFGLVSAFATSIPADYVNTQTLLSGYSLYTKNGDRFNSSSFSFFVFR